ncbi:hypothetical protein QAD02_009021, partial [Eretmocerus hayati]
MVPTIFCSGALITQRHVLTGPNCISVIDKDQTRVYGGAIDLMLCDAYEVESWKKYSEWNPYGDQLYHRKAPDVAIITLLHAVDEKKMRPLIVSDRSSQELYGLETIVLGWDDPPSKHQNRKLMTMTLVISEREACTAFAREPMKTFLRNERIVCSIARDRLCE